MCEIFQKRFRKQGKIHLFSVLESKAVSRMLERDPQLHNHSQDRVHRMRLYQEKRSDLLHRDQTLLDFANAHGYFGIHPAEGGWVCREWAPDAHQIYLTGDFNGWQKTEHPMMRLGNGCWVLYLPGETALWEGCRVKTVVEGDLSWKMRVPVCTQRVAKEAATDTWCAEVVDGRKKFHWTDDDFSPEQDLRIYKFRFNIDQQDTYREFADRILPGVKEAGYNTLRLQSGMPHSENEAAVGEICNRFAVPSQLGKPADLKYLVNKAHGMGIRVLMDFCHSEQCGAAQSLCVDYGKNETLHFLLSSLRVWMEEYHLDGFYFADVVSMLNHEDSQKGNVCLDAVIYLQLANELIRQINPKAITMTAEIPAFPDLCQPVSAGGIGFDRCMDI